VLVGGWGFQTYPLWRIPLPAGEPRRVGTFEAQDARFFPDGRVVFAQGTGLYVSEKDGSNVRKLLDAPDDVLCPQLSPDGKRIAFRTRFAGDVWDSLAEAGADGSNLKVLLRGTVESRLSCPVWTADGKYLLFSAGNVGRRDIWVLPTEGGFFHRNRRATQLTNGPLL
jgi:Tol biopolymer transport system component